MRRERRILDFVRCRSEGCAKPSWRVTELLIMRVEIEVMGSRRAATLMTLMTGRSRGRVFGLSRLWPSGWESIISECFNPHVSSIVLAVPSRLTGGIGGADDDCGIRVDCAGWRKGVVPLV